MLDHVSRGDQTNSGAEVSPEGKCPQHEKVALDVGDQVATRTWADFQSDAAGVFALSHNLEQFLDGQFTAAAEWKVTVGFPNAV